MWHWGGIKSDGLSIANEVIWREEDFILRTSRQQIFNVRNMRFYAP